MEGVAGGPVRAADPFTSGSRRETARLEAKEAAFWRYFQDRVSEWNPCYGEDGDVRFRWDEEVGAHDVEMEMGASIGVPLDAFCPDVSELPHTVHLRSLLERVLLEEDGAPRGVVDLNPVRQLVAALVNNGGRHARHGKNPPVSRKDACARV